MAERPSPRVPAGQVGRRPRLPAEGLRGRRRPDRSRRGQWRVSLQRHRLQPGQQRARRPLRGALHRQQQQGERRRDAGPGPDQVRGHGRRRHRQCGTVSGQADARARRSAFGSHALHDPDPEGRRRHADADVPGRPCVSRVHGLRRRQQQPPHEAPRCGLGRLRGDVGTARQGDGRQPHRPGRRARDRSRDRSDQRGVAALREQEGTERHLRLPLDGRRQEVVQRDGRRLAARLRRRESGSSHALRPGDDLRLVPDERLPRPRGRRVRARLSRVVAAGRGAQRRRARRRVDVDERHGLDSAGRRRQRHRRRRRGQPVPRPHGPRAPAHARAPFRGGQGDGPLLRPPAGPHVRPLHARPPRAESGGALLHRVSPAGRRALLGPEGLHALRHGRGPDPPTAHAGRPRRAGEPGGDPLVHVRPRVALRLREPARRHGHRAAPDQPAEPPDVRPGNGAVHGRLHRRRRPAAVRAAPGPVVGVQHGPREGRRLPGRLDGQPRRAAAGGRQLGELHARGQHRRAERLRPHAEHPRLREWPDRDAQPERLHGEDQHGPRRLDTLEREAPDDSIPAHLRDGRPERHGVHEELSPHDREPAPGRQGVLPAGPDRRPARPADDGRRLDRAAFEHFPPRFRHVHRSQRSGDRERRRDLRAFGLPRLGWADGRRDFQSRRLQPGRLQSGRLQPGRLEPRRLERRGLHARRLEPGRLESRTSPTRTSPTPTSRIPTSRTPTSPTPTSRTSASRRRTFRIPTSPTRTSPTRTSPTRTFRIRD